MESGFQPFVPLLICSLSKTPISRCPHVYKGNSVLRVRSFRKFSTHTYTYDEPKDFSDQMNKVCQDTEMNHPCLATAEKNRHSLKR